MATATIALLTLPAWAHSAVVDDPLGEPPGDPDDAPFMRPPYGQPKPASLRRDTGLTSAWGTDRRVQLTLMPSYAALKMGFLGRRQGKTFHGVGAGLDLDVQLWKYLWLRFSGSYTAHPVHENIVRNEEDEPVRVAQAGTMHVGGGALGLVFALSFGRMLALLEAGGGVMMIRTPPAARSGQLGGRCLEGGGCDPGLSCAADNVCRPAAVPELHAGVAAEWMLRERWSIGLSLRYYALLDDPTTYPIYLLLSGRLAARW